MTREQKIPGPDHPITVEPADEHVVVRHGDTVIADTRAPLVLREASYPPVHYIPPSDVDWSVLSDSDTVSYCPFKGDASYASLTGDGDTVKDVLWKYDEPYPAVAEIAGHVAFYPDRVDVTTD